MYAKTCIVFSPFAISVVLFILSRNFHHKICGCEMSLAAGVCVWMCAFVNVLLTTYIRLRIRELSKGSTARQTYIITKRWRNYFFFLSLCLYVLSLKFTLAVCPRIIRASARTRNKINTRSVIYLPIFLNHIKSKMAKKQKTKKKNSSSNSKGVIKIRNL